MQNRKRVKNIFQKEKRGNIGSIDSDWDDTAEWSIDNINIRINNSNYDSEEDDNWNKNINLDNISKLLDTYN